MLFCLGVVTVRQLGEGGSGVEGGLAGVLLLRSSQDARRVRVTSRERLFESTNAPQQTLNNPIIAAVSREARGKEAGKMLVPINADPSAGGDSSVPEFLIVELQGALVPRNSEDSSSSSSSSSSAPSAGAGVAGAGGGFDEKVVGELKLKTPMGYPVLLVGNHKLEGKMSSLSKPLGKSCLVPSYSHLPPSNERLAQTDTSQNNRSNLGTGRRQEEEARCRRGRKLRGRRQQEGQKRRVSHRRRREEEGAVQAPPEERYQKVDEGLRTFALNKQQ